MINDGVSFGFLPGLSPWVFLVILIGLLLYAVKMRELWGRVGVGLVIAGGIGNLVQRIMYGAVVDNWNFFGIFYNNVWDYLIGVGMVVFVISSVVEKSK